MGQVIEYRMLKSHQQAFRLLIYCNASAEDNASAFSINKPLAEKLQALKASRRTMRIEKLFNEVLSTLPDGCIVKDIDVLFNPAYKIDVMKILVEANKRKPFTLIWNGNYFDGRLTYSEDHLLDYHSYEINNYDIVCVV